MTRFPLLLSYFAWTSPSFTNAQFSETASVTSSVSPTASSLDIPIEVTDLRIVNFTMYTITNENENPDETLLTLSVVLTALGGFLIVTKVLHSIFFKRRRAIVADTRPIELSEFKIVIRPAETT